MIIIETENGMVFVNQNNAYSAVHMKKEAKFRVFYDTEHSHTIEGVISVRYLNDNHEADIRDDGNELEELQKRFDERTRWSNKLRKCYIDLEEEIAELKSKVKDNVFIVVEDCDNDETRNVACFSTKSAAQKYCDHYNENLSKPRFCFEEWKIGESYNYNTQEK